MTAAEFKARFVEFASVADETVDVYISDASLMVVEERWGSIYTIGLSYLAAHYLSLAIGTSNGNSNPQNEIASQSVDGVSISYTTAKAGDDDSFYNATQYGKTYISLRSQIALGNFQNA